MSSYRRVRGRINEAVILFVLFFGPVFLALLAYLGPWEIIPDRSAAYGVLMDPAIPLAEQPLSFEATGTNDHDWLTRRWSLIYLSVASCDGTCQERVAALGQVHKALAEDRGRVQTVFLHRAGVQPPRAGGFQNIALTGDAGEQLAAQLTTAHPGPIYISDPLGNLVLAYPADAREQGILKDLERLLRLSRIG